MPVKREVGWLETISGCMFSGKSTELIRRLRNAMIAGYKVQIFKHSIDDRYNKDSITTHDGSSINSEQILNTKDFRKLLKPDTEVVGIDEAQFFGLVDGHLTNDGLDFIKEIKKATYNGVVVIVSGLDMDSNGEPFGIMPRLMATAQKVNKLKAVCVKCGHDATMTYRLTEDNQRVIVSGNDGAFDARCLACWLKGNKENKND